MLDDFKPWWIRRKAPAMMYCESCKKEAHATTTTDDRAFIERHEKCSPPKVEPLFKK